MPAGIQPGDLLIAIGTLDSSGTLSTASPGWTLRDHTIAATYGQCTSAWWFKVATGSDALAVDYSIVENFNYVILRITGHSGAPESAVASGFDGNPNSPSLTASWGAQDALWIAAFGEDNNKTITAWPATYTLSQITQTEGTTTGTTMGVATKNFSGATDNPAAWTMSQEENWVAFTIAVQGSAGGADTSLDGAAVGVASATGDLTAPGDTSLDGAGAGQSSATGDLTTGASGNIRLQPSFDHQRGHYAASLTGVEYWVLSADKLSIIQHGTVSLDANGRPTIDINGSPFSVGDYVPLILALATGGPELYNLTIRSGMIYALAEAQA